MHEIIIDLGYWVSAFSMEFVISEDQEAPSQRAAEVSCMCLHVSRNIEKKKPCDSELLFNPMI